jgi:hypothetical protein
MHTNVSTGTLHYLSVTCNVAQEGMSTRNGDSLASKSLVRTPKACVLSSFARISVPEAESSYRMSQNYSAYPSSFGDLKFKMSHIRYAESSKC